MSYYHRVPMHYAFGLLHSRRNESARQILVVDENFEIRHQLRDILEEANFRVLEASSAKQALTLCEKNSVKLAVVDSSLPFDLSTTAMEAIHDDHPELAVLALVEIAQRARQCIRIAEQIGARSIVEKSSMEECLIEAIEYVLNGGQSTARYWPA